MYFTKNESIGFKNFDQCYKNWWMRASKDKSIDLAKVFLFYPDEYIQSFKEK